MTVELHDPRLPPRFWAKVQVQGDCWVWTGAKGGPGEKYGYVNIGGKIRRSHRVAYEALVGPIPAGLQLDHLCRVRACVNPAHLEPVTNRENGLRGQTLSAREIAKTHCSHGHLYDEANTAMYNGKRSCRECNREKARLRYQPNDIWRQRLIPILPRHAPGITAAEILRTLGILDTSWMGTMKALVRDGVVERAGVGGRGEPYRYRLR